MLNIVYPILVLIVAFAAIIRGFRRGITRQLPSLLGFAFGAVASRLLTPEFAPSFLFTAPWTQTPEFADFTSNLVCGVVIYFVVYFLCSLFLGILGKTVSVFRIGIFNRITGAFFSLVKNLLWLSIFFNLLLCFSPASSLMDYERADDGNLIAAVMKLTPAILGCYGAEDFAHFSQLKEAKFISSSHIIIYNKEMSGSQNLNPSLNVILTQV